MKTVISKRCCFCGREFSNMPALPQAPDKQKTKSDSFLSVDTTIQVIISFLLMATVARIIFGQPLPPDELKFLMFIFGSSGIIAGIKHLVDRWRNK